MTEEAINPGLLPRPETDQFQQEMLNPQFLEEGRVLYAIFLLNQDKVAEGVMPVVINFAHGEQASAGPGRFDLNAFAQTIDRPLIAIDMAGMGKSKWLKVGDVASATFDSLAQNHLNILYRLGVEDFDIVGNSMGAIMAAKIAALAGDRAKHLVTFSSPGFEDRPIGTMVLRNARQSRKDSHETRAALPPVIRDEVTAAYDHRKLNPGDRRVQMVRSVLRYGRLLTQNSLAQIEDTLSPSTKWLDVIGDKDAFSDWNKHVEAVNARNRNLPDMSAIQVMDDTTHSWQSYYRWEVAEVAAEAIAA